MDAVDLELPAVHHIGHIGRRDCTGRKDCTGQAVGTAAAAALLVVAVAVVVAGEGPGQEAFDLEELHLVAVLLGNEAVVGSALKCVGCFVAEALVVAVVVGSFQIDQG